MAAGYAWDWISKNDNTVYDIEIRGIKKRWNHCTEGWAHSEKAIDEVLKFRDDREWKHKIKEELADVVNYCILMADTCGLDLDEIVRDKVKKNNEKYPVEKAFGCKEKYTELK